MTELANLISKIGKRKAFELLERHLKDEDSVRENVLTIVVNKGVHHRPEEKLRGTILYASEGNLNFSSIESVHAELEGILKRVSRALKSTSWNRVYIVPFGPCALSMQIKLLVYRITRIESVEIFYLGDGEYKDLDLKQRNIIVNTESSLGSSNV